MSGKEKLTIGVLSCFSVESVAREKYGISKQEFCRMISRIRPRPLLLQYQGTLYISEAELTMLERNRTDIGGPAAFLLGQLN